MFNAKPVVLDRKTGGKNGGRQTLFIERGSVSVCGGIQAPTLQKALGRERYEDGLAAYGMNDAASTIMGTSGFIADVLDAGKVQCSSCHDVHDSPKAVAGTHLLRVENGNANPSGLCLTCHDK